MRIIRLIVAYIIRNFLLLTILVAGAIAVWVFWPKGQKQSTASVSTAPSPTVSMTVAEFDRKIEAVKAETTKVVREKVEVERPLPHPVESYGVATFRPTTTLNEINSRNVPTISRTEAHVAPNGKFHLLYGVDPMLKEERMITVGGETVTLLEPDWKTVRPKGKLVLLENPPKGLNLPLGRYAVAIVE